MAKMTIQYDRELAIALGNSRKTKVWKNRTMQWSELLNRLATTTRTSETMAEYKAMSRDKQSAVKDVGGFVGGYCHDGKRTQVDFRSILCLDADFADAELWSDWELLYGKAAAVYSTHKHTQNKHRLRLVIPLSRDVNGEEYQAIGRRVAEVLGIDKFDDTTYSPQRLMYWPSTSQDGPYVFNYLDAPLLDPDEVLDTYHDWRDASAWPMSSRVAELAHKTAESQKDPLSKPGLVGAFCRAYSIQEAIAEYVPDYTPCDEQGRYTYAGGSTAAGVVIYDDKFAYSHHATDPSSGQLCNAWDLVRLHKFADLDEGIDPDKPTSQRPSYKAMSKLAAEDKRVKAQVITDKTQEAYADFEEDVPEEQNTEWTAELKLTEKGTIAQTIGNTVLILENDPKLKGAIGYNEMDHMVTVRRKLPWEHEGKAKTWTDSDDSALRHYLEGTYGISSKDKIMDALNVIIQRNKFHPVREYLDSCEWDGEPRVETLLVDYLGAEDSEYTRAVTRKTLAAAVARIYHPGCKFDYMLTLKGRQGLGKSALIAKLGGEWFSDTFTTMQGKEALEQVQGVWLMEVGELAGMRKAEAETIKLYVSKQCDRFRPAYGRRLQEFPRQCIFIGTTNESTFLRDNTGNRRFWVVECAETPALSMWEDLTPEVIQKIWGEAVDIYKRGESLYLSKDIEEIAEAVQRSFEEENPMAGVIAKYLDRLLPENWETMDTYDRRAWLETDAEGTEQRKTVCTLEVWAEALGGNPDKLDRYAVKEIRAVLEKLPEWKNMGSRQLRTKIYGKQRYYRRRTDL